MGAGIAASGVGRERVFITTKVRPDRMGEGDLQRSVEESLRKLQVSQVDLLLLHWPNPAIPLAESVRALNEVKRSGMTRHIGLSNFTSAMLAEAWRLTAEPFAAEQIEYHPYLDQTTMRAALRSRAMALIAYCPIALGKVVGDPRIEAIAAAHGRSAPRSRCAGWCSRKASRRSRAPRSSSAWPRTWRSSTSRSATRRWRR